MPEELDELEEMETAEVEQEEREDPEESESGSEDGKRQRPVTTAAFDRRFSKVARVVIEAITPENLLGDISALKTLREMIGKVEKDRQKRVDAKTARAREARRKKALESGDELGALRLSAPIASEAWEH